MKNWNSKQREYTPIKSDRVIAIARMAREMHKQGIPVIAIAHTLQRSKSRIYEYIKEDFFAPHTDNK